jgi:hypothetical protein
VSTGVDQELTAAFKLASEFVQPHPELAERVRAGARRRRRRTLAGTAAATAAVIGIAFITYAAGGYHRDTAAASQRNSGSPRILTTVDYQVTQLAVSGQYLYVLAGQNSWLTAYDRATGKLIRRLNIPSGPSALAIGPGGLVWLAFYPPPAGPTAIWLLSPDLQLHSADAGIEASTILPTARTTALITDQYGLVRVHMPAPGQSGQASQHLQPGSSLGAATATPPGGWSDELDGRVAVYVTNGSRTDGHIVLAGSPSLRFGGSSRTQISAMSSTGTSLWVTTYTLINGEASTQGALVRLNARLALTTPASVRSSPVLARSESVWSAGDTVWVATGVPGHSLVCFTAGATLGPVATLPVSGEVVALTATADTVYVNALQPPGSYAPSPVTGYPIPAACR